MVTSAIVPEKRLPRKPVRSSRTIGCGVERIRAANRGQVRKHRSTGIAGRDRRIKSRAVQGNTRMLRDHGGTLTIIQNARGNVIPDADRPCGRHGQKSHEDERLVAGNSPECAAQKLATGDPSQTRE